MTLMTIGLAHDRLYGNIMLKGMNGIQPHMLANDGSL